MRILLNTVTLLAIGLLIAAVAVLWPCAGPLLTWELASCAAITTVPSGA
jgi:hypothetical protein